MKILSIDIECIFRMEFNSKDVDEKNQHDAKNLLLFHERSLKADLLISEATSNKPVVGFL